MPRCPHCGHQSGAGWDDDDLAIVLDSGERRRFTGHEWRILVPLRQHMGQLISHDTLLSFLYMGVGGDGPDDPGLTVKICGIRRKLAGTGWRIVNRHAAGYRLDADAAPGPGPAAASTAGRNETDDAR